MQVRIRDYADLINQIEGIEQQAEKVIKRTVSDFRSRAPGWISPAVIETYNVKKGDVNKAVASKAVRGTARIGGRIVDNAQIVYAGKVMTPIHFGMKPTKRPKNKRSYEVTAEIFKGRRKSLGRSTFLGGGGGGKQIPFKRKGPNRLPIEAIRTLSVPQMIDNDTVSAKIKTNLAEKLGERLAHHIQRELSR